MPGPQPINLSTETLKAIRDAWTNYERLVSAQPLMQPKTKRTYLLHSENFVRWLEGDFVPGATLPRGR
jgi:hypothetical protein